MLSLQYRTAFYEASYGTLVSHIIKPDSLEVKLRDFLDVVKFTEFNYTYLKRINSFHTVIHDKDLLSSLIVPTTFELRHFYLNTARGICFAGKKSLIVKLFVLDFVVSRASAFPSSSSELGVAIAKLRLSCKVI